MERVIGGKGDRGGAVARDRGAERLRERDEIRPRAGPSEEDRGALRLDEQTRGARERVRIGRRSGRRRDARDVGERDRGLEPLLLEARVEAHVHRAAGLEVRELPRAEKGVRERGDARRLVLPLHKVADELALLLRRSEERRVGKEGRSWEA